MDAQFVARGGPFYHPATHHQYYYPPPPYPIHPSWYGFDPHHLQREDYSPHLHTGYYHQGVDGIYEDQAFQPIEQVEPNVSIDIKTTDLPTSPPNKPRVPSHQRTISNPCDYAGVVVAPREVSKSPSPPRSPSPSSFSPPSSVHSNPEGAVEEVHESGGGEKGEGKKEKDKQVEEVDNKSPTSPEPPLQERRVRSPPPTFANLAIPGQRKPHSKKKKKKESVSDAEGTNTNEPNINTRKAWSLEHQRSYEDGHEEEHEHGYGPAYMPGWQYRRGSECYPYWMGPPASGPMCYNFLAQQPAHPHQMLPERFHSRPHSHSSPRVPSRPSSSSSFVCPPLSSSPSPHPTSRPSSSIKASSRPPSSHTANAIVHLNIGGYRFATTKCTLTTNGHNYFTALLSGSIPSTKDSSGAYFIDRDGQYFTTILTYLRTCQLPNRFKGNWKDVLREAEYYAIEPLIRVLREKETNDQTLKRVAFEVNYSKNEMFETIRMLIINKLWDRVKEGQPKVYLYFIRESKEVEKEIEKYLRVYPENQKIVYEEFNLVCSSSDCLPNTQYFNFLMSLQNRNLISDKFHHSSLSICFTVKISGFSMYGRPVYSWIQVEWPAGVSTQAASQQ